MVGTQGGRELFVAPHAAAVALPAGLGDLEGLAGRVGDLQVGVDVGKQDLLELGLLLDVALLRALLELVERRLGDVDEAGVDQLRHLPVEERQDEGPDVGAVDVGVGHEDDLVVPGVLDVELALDPGPDGGDQRLDLLVLEDLVDPRLLDVEDLPSQGKHRLRVTVAALLGRAAGGVALDDEDLGERRVLHRAVGEFARKP